MENMSLQLEFALRKTSTLNAKLSKLLDKRA